MWVLNNSDSENTATNTPLPDFNGNFTVFNLSALGDNTLT